MIESERLFLRKPTAADVEDPPPFLVDSRVMDFLGGAAIGLGVLLMILVVIVAIALLIKTLFF